MQKLCRMMEEVERMTVADLDGELDEVEDRVGMGMGMGGMFAGPDSDEDLIN